MTARIPAARPVVLVDANVLYSRVLRDYVLYCADAEIISVVWSKRILREMVRHLVNKVDGFTDGAGHRLVGAMNRAFPYAQVDESGPRPSLPSLVTLPDENDRHVIEAVIYAGATMLCTFNLKDFPGPLMRGLGCSVASPDELVEMLVEERPAAMLKVHRTVVAQLPGATDESTFRALRRAGAHVAAASIERLIRDS